jgi:hypothetical protein
VIVVPGQVVRGAAPQWWMDKRHWNDELTFDEVMAFYAAGEIDEDELAELLRG